MFVDATGQDASIITYMYVPHPTILAVVWCARSVLADVITYVKGRKGHEIAVSFRQKAISSHAD